MPENDCISDSSVVANGFISFNLESKWIANR